MIVPHADSAGSLRLLVGLGAAIGGGIATFTGVAWLLRIPEWHQVAGLIKRSLLPT
ncbi:hypothetical protein [Desulfosarcina cetonica]|uniref:hypothetical protein n=1 Tax=Desulfosarcina cetonica TaxID=90730 RepID=UPI0012EDAF53|nr:hypothetical protein [Desulfosarcina cetonica]